MEVPRSLSPLKVPFGLRGGRLFEPRQVESGGRCNCVCPECRAPLIARHYSAGTTRSHFAHLSDSECSGGIESALHLAAKQLIADRRELYLPDLIATLSKPGKCKPVIERSSMVYPGELTALDRVRLEESVGAIRPDLIVKVLDQEILVEIAYTHFISSEKLHYICQRKMPTIEVDISDIACLNFEELGNRLFKASARAHWVYHPERSARELELQPLLAADLAQDLLEWQRKQANESKRAAKRKELELKMELALKDEKYRRAIARAQEIAEKRAQPNDEKLVQALAFLGPSGSDMNMFLPVRVRNQSSIDAQPILWQIVAFAGVIHPALKHGKHLLRADTLRTWIAERFRADASSASMAVTVWDFLHGLVDLNVLHKVRRQEFLVAVPDVVGALEVATDAQENSTRELVWSMDWPSFQKTQALTNVFASIYGRKDSWARIAGLFESVKLDRTPTDIIAHYRRPINGSMNAVELRRYFLSAGIARLKTLECDS